MSRFIRKGYYTYISLAQAEINLIPITMRSPSPIEDDGMFRVVASCDECHLLEVITGEDLSTSWDDWFIINLLED
jgi:hypothetical protein